MIRTVHLFRAEQSSRLGTERDAQGRVWCRLFPLGTWHRTDFPEGKLELTPDFLGELLANWKAGGSPPLPVDYNHEEDGPAAGWIEDLRLSPTGELEGAIKWTDEAAADIKADKRRYLSPTWALQHVNRRTGLKGGPWLYGAALLNDPYFDSMPRVAASAAAAAQPTTPPTTVAPRGEEKRMDKKRICAALGLPEDCGEEEMMVVIESMAKKAKELEDGMAKQAASAGESEKLTAAIRASVEPLEAQLKAAREETQALKASLLERDVDALVTSAKLAGKPAESFRPFIASAAARDMAEAKRMVDALPVVISTSEKGLANAEAPTASTAAQKFELLVQEKLAAGMKSTVAYSLVAREHPELAVLAFPTPTTSTR